MRLGLGSGAAGGAGKGRSYPLLRLGSKLLAYWDAMDRASLDLDGQGRVTAWRDKVAGLVASQATAAARPTHDYGAFGGDPGLILLGDQFLGFNSATLPTGSAPCEMWALVQQGALGGDTTARYPLAYGSGAGAGSRRLRRAPASSVNRGSVAVGTGSATVTAQEGTQDLSARHLMRGVVGASTIAAEVDGVLSAATSAVPATSGTRGAIGGSDATTFANGWIGLVAVILVTAPLSAQEAIFVRDVLG